MNAPFPDDYELETHEDRTTEVLLFDALPGGTDITFIDQNFGNSSFKVVNSIIQIAVGNSFDASVHMACFLLQFGTVLFRTVSPTHNMLVLDCGHGLAGIVALKQGWKDVTFVDNCAETLLRSTWPNVYLNCPENMAMVRCIKANSWHALYDGDTYPAGHHVELVLLALADDSTTIQKWEQVGCYYIKYSFISHHLPNVM